MPSLIFKLYVLKMGLTLKIFLTFTKDCIKTDFWISGKSHSDFSQNECLNPNRDIM